MTLKKQTHKPKSCVARSVVLCGVQSARLRAFLGRALTLASWISFPGLLVFGPISAAAQELPGEELYVAPEPLKLETSAKQKTSPLVNRKKSTGEEGAGNLPGIYSVGSHRQSTSSELVLPPKGSSDTLKALKVGEKLEAKINHSIIAFADEKAPVVADLGKGLRLIGDSRLEKNSKRIFIEFTTAVQNGKVYHLKASALTDLGQPGFEGEYHSRELEYFSGDFISSFVAGYFDGLVPRNRNAFGQIEEDTNVDSALKKGMSKGAMSSAERFREKLKKTPEFSELNGPLDIEILILEPAITKD